MSNGPWTDHENDLIVADYFAMLADDVSGRPYKKAEHRRGLLPLLNDRAEGSVEFKPQNISAVLKGLAVLAISTNLLSRYVTVGAETDIMTACPPTVEASRKFQARAADELSLLPHGWILGEMRADDAVMRALVRINIACCYSCH